MDEPEQTNSWSWRSSARAAGRNGRTALLVVWTLAAIVMVAGPEETFTAYGRLAAGTEVGADAGRLLFLGMGAAQATVLALAVSAGSLLLRLGARVIRLSRAALARHPAQEAAHG